MKVRGIVFRQLDPAYAFRFADGYDFGEKVGERTARFFIGATGR